MNRTLRNGLAVAGMAGGMLFLGQAVASAEDVVQDNTANVGQEDGRGGNDADIEQDNDLDLEAEAEGGNAGVSVDVDNVVVNSVEGGGTGGSSGSADKKAPAPTPTTVRVTFDTTLNNDIAVDSTVVGSGNGVIDAPDVTQTNTANVDQKSDDDGRKGNHNYPPKKDNVASFSGGGGGGGGGGNDADVDQDNEADIDLDAEGGDVGVDVDVDNAVINTVNCWGDKDSSVSCDVTFNTTINNNIDIRSVICGSGNAVIGTLPSFVCNLGPAAAAPAAAPAAQAKPAEQKHHAAANARSAPKAMSSAQPSKGQLAYTGSDVSAPLTLGLLALGAGGALSLAGRRREATTV